MLVEENNKWYNLTELCALTGLHKNTIRSYVREGRVESKKVKGKYGLEIIISHNSLSGVGITINGADKNSMLVDDSGSDTDRDNKLGEKLFNIKGSDGIKENPYISTNIYKDIMSKYEQAVYRSGWLEGQLDTTRKLLMESQETIRQREEILIKEKTAAEEKAKQKETDLILANEEKKKILDETEGLKKQNKELQKELDKINLRKNISWWRRATQTKEKIEADIEKELSKKYS